MLSLHASGAECGATLSDRMAADTDPSPRFLVVGGAAPVMVYFCPDASAPKARMVHSTAKASVVQAVGAAMEGQVRSVEARDASDLAEILGDVAGSR